MAVERVDQALLARGLADSIDQARILIMEGRVYLGADKVSKPSDKARPGLPLSVRGAKQAYVSRGGHKLKKALDVFGISAQGAVCIDVGASTGGFTDVLLRAGARRVYAVDVGYGQLDYRLRSDGRVCVMERTNARFLTKEMFDPLPALGATDVSFISLKAVLPAALSVMAPQSRFVALIKPQFEAAREEVGPRGVVRDRAVHEKVIAEIARFVGTLGFCAQGLDFSPITGPEGNIEFLMDIRPAGCARGQVDSERITHVLDAAYDKFVKSV